MARGRLLVLTVVLLTVALVGAGGFLTARHIFRPMTITAVFTSATSIYPGDDVRIAGVRVGRIESITPDGTHATVHLRVDHGVPVPADARAVIVAQNLVSARFVQLTPAYTAGPTMADGAVIPQTQTAVPVEWDEVKEQLTRLAADLGPDGEASTSSVGRLIDSAATAMAGNGAKLRETLAQLSGISRILADGSGDIVDIVTHLQTFLSALRDSRQQIVQFQDRLVSLTSVLDGGRSDLDDALTNLAQAVGDVQRFVAGTRDKASEQVQRLANVTQNLVDNRMDLEQVLHVAPSAIANSYNMFDPRTGGASGVFVLNNFSDPVQFICGMIGALENVTAPETAKLCARYLGPALETLDFNYLPFPFNPLLASVPTPDKVIYSEPHLAPGGATDTAAADLPDILLPAERPGP